MSRPRKSHTWTLLPAGNLPPASEVTNLLGAVVLDFEDPTAVTVEFDPSSITNIERKFLETSDESFEALLIRERDEDVHGRLENIFSSSFGTSVRQIQNRESKRVKTYTLKHQDKIFNSMNARHSGEIMRLLDKTPRRGPRLIYSANAVFMVVGIKVAFDLELNASVSAHTNQAVDVTVPVEAIVAGYTSVQPPVSVDPSAGYAFHSQLSNDVKQVANGARIFAVRYRLVKKRKDWKITPKPSIQTRAALDDVFTVRSNEGIFTGKEHHYSDGDTEESEGEEEEEEQQQLNTRSEPGPDDFEMGDLEFTACLSNESEKIIVANL
jgi:hypothetical protein